MEENNIEMTLMKHNNKKNWAYAIFEIKFLNGRINTETAANSHNSQNHVQYT